MIPWILPEGGRQRPEISHRRTRMRGTSQQDHHSTQAGERQSELKKRVSQPASSADDRPLPRRQSLLPKTIIPSDDRTRTFRAASSGSTRWRGLQERQPRSMIQFVTLQQEKAQHAECERMSEQLRKEMEKGRVYGGKLGFDFSRGSRARQDRGRHMTKQEPTRPAN